MAPESLSLFAPGVLATGVREGASAEDAKSSEGEFQSTAMWTWACCCVSVIICMETYLHSKRSHRGGNARLHYNAVFYLVTEDLTNVKVKLKAFELYLSTSLDATFWTVLAFTMSDHLYSRIRWYSRSNPSGKSGSCRRGGNSTICLLLRS